jgi:isoleucyl-tRNA synthetase
VQETRKAAGFRVSDRISLSLYFASESERDGVEPFSATIAQETLALDIRFIDTEEENVEVFAALHGAPGAFRSLVAAGRYANDGDVLVEVTILGAGTDV